MGFIRRAERILEDRQPLRLDHGLLVAALAAQQTASVAARPGPPPAVIPAAVEGEDDPIIELLNAGPGWRRAACRQRGCFSRAEAGRRVNAP
ncbi:hypothetical protein [Sphingosinicella terrae]|uniref:hypothetical protein n=1 Tax=Sphingosinicella terrae TaxID=2172047 RepID=UPI0013B359D1|nr:hypothetical protein [Sphingosinicella terrae]